MSETESIRLPKSLIVRTNEIAKQTHRTRAFIVAQAIDLYLQEFADLQVALDALNDPTDPGLTDTEAREFVGV